MTGAPRFRQDLLAEAVEDGGKKFVDVADPDNGTCYRFYEIEYSLACAMDGERDVAGIVKWATDELGMTPKADEVKSVIATLGSLGFIDTGAAAPAHAPAAPGPAPAHAPAAKPTPAAMNRWDQPTAMGDADDYLSPGVVVGKTPVAPAPKGIDIELGNVASARAPQHDLPASDDLELGSPGGLGLNTDKTIGTQEIPLGASGKAPDISVDLADQMSLKPADVKEAVRASQVMKAVDVPKELQDELEAPKPIEAKKPERRDATPPPKPRPTPVPAEAKKPEAKKPEAKPAEQPKAEAKKPAPAEAKKPAEQPKAPERPSAPPAPAPKISPVLLAALVLVVLGAGAFLAYKVVIKKSEKTDKQSQSQQPPPPKPPEPPPPPPVESEKLASEQPAAEELKAPAAGVVETIVANDTQAKVGDVIVAFVGDKPIANELNGLQKDEKRLQTDVANAEKERDAAEKAGNKAGVTAAEKKIETAKKAVEDKQAKIATRTADLDKFVIKAAVAGKVEAVAKANAKVAANDVVAKLTPEPVMAATFKTTTPPVTADARVFLAVKGSEQKLSCKVIDLTAGAKIACPKDAAPAGTEVTFAGIDTSAPAEIEMGDEPKPEGSAGSAAKAPTPPAPAPAPKAPAPAPAKAPAPAPAPAPGAGSAG